MTEFHPTPANEVRDLALLYTSKAIEYRRALANGDKAATNRASFRAYNLSLNVLEIAGAEFAEALLNYCRDEAELIASLPKGVNVVGHWACEGVAR